MIDNRGVVMPRGLNLWIIPEVMIRGIKSGATKKKKKRNLGESSDLGLPICTAEGSPFVILQGPSWAGHS